MTSVCIGIFKDWPLFETLPSGWVIDKHTGSPVHGYEFCTNGLSMIDKDRSRALVRIPTRSDQCLTSVPVAPAAPNGRDKKTGDPMGPINASTVNDLARARFKVRLLSDISADLMVCELEGWCKMQYINELKLLINSIGST